MKTNTIFRMLLVAFLLSIGNHTTKAAKTVIWDTVTQMENNVSIKLPYGVFENVQVGDYLYITANKTSNSNTWWSYSMYYGYNQPFYGISRDNNSSIYDGSIIKIEITQSILEKLQYKQLDWKSDVDEENSRVIVYGENITIQEIAIFTNRTTNKADITLSFSPSSLTVGLEESFSAPTLTATANRRTVTGLSYTYSSSNTDVATVDNNGTLTINALGTTTITATFAGNNNYNSATASYSLTVVPSYTITFKLDNEDFDIQHLKAGDVIRPKTPDYRSGYRFSGWENLPYTMPARDLIIYGYYEKIDQYVTLSVGSTGYSTYCPDQPLRFNGTEDIKAYIAKVKSDTEVKLVQVVGTVAPGTGLVLKGWTANVSTNIYTAESGDTYSQNLLVGVVGSPAVINNANQYVLVNKDGVAKFADTQYNPAVVPVGKAYLEAPANSRILSFSFDDETTSIDAIRMLKSESQSTEVYNLNGQRINSPKRGLYLMNGKKVVIK